MTYENLNKPLSEQTDEFGISVKEHLEVRGRYSNDAMEQVLRRIKTTAANWLFVYGVPQHPGDLLQYSRSLAEGLLSSLVLDNIVTINESALASQEEQAEASAEADRYVQQTLGDMFRHLAGDLDRDDRAEVETPMGAYL